MNKTNKYLTNAIINIIEQSKWNLLMLRQVHILVLKLNIMINTINLKFMIVLEYQFLRIFLQKLNSKMVRWSFWDWQVQITVPWEYVIQDYNGEEIVGTFYEK